MPPVTNDKDGLLAEIDSEIIARFTNLTHVTDRKPGPIKKSLSLKLEYRWIVVKTRRHRYRGAVFYKAILHLFHPKAACRSFKISYIFQSNTPAFASTIAIGIHSLPYTG